MIGEGDRRPAEPIGGCSTWPGLFLTGAAGYLGRMRVVGIGVAIGSGDSGDGPRKRQSDRSRRKLLVLASDIVGADGTANDVLNQFQQMAVLNFLNAVGENYKHALDPIAFPALELVSQCFASQRERVPAGGLGPPQP